MGKIFCKNYIALIISIVTIVFIFCGPGRSDSAMQEGELFEKAYNYYLSYQPGKAIESFDIFLKEYPASPSKDAALFWKARSLVQINRKEEARNIFREIAENFPASHFRGFAETELENINKTETSGNAEKALSKAVEEKNICPESLAIEKKKTEALSGMAAQLRKDKAALEKKLKDLQGEMGAMSARLKRLSDKLISRKFANTPIDEADIKKYYEENKSEFISTQGKEFLRVLSVSYTEENELDRNLLVIEIQNLAINGASFENIHKKYSGLSSFEKLSAGEAPDWIKEETSRLKEGEVSNIISRDNNYIIIQIQKIETVFRKYEEVRSEIKKKLFEKNKTDNQALNRWLKEVLADAEKPSVAQKKTGSTKKGKKSGNKKTVLRKKH